MAAKAVVKKSFFITFEGPEGSGKSSQAKRLVQALRRAGRSVVFVRDPGSTNLGRRLRTVLLHDARQQPSPLTEALLFIAGRIQLVEERIRPALRAGRIVVADRFHDSTVAYQGFGGRVEIGWLDQLGRQAIRRLMPNLTILLDLPTEVGFARLKNRKDRMEQKAVAFHRRVRQGYRRLAQREPRRFIVIDATQSQAQIHDHILTIVSKRLSNRQHLC